MNRRRGYNFIEIMVTSLVFSTMILSLMSVWINHARSVAKARTRLAASYLAQYQMEECLSRGFFGVDGMDTRTRAPEGEEFTIKTTLRGTESKFLYHYHIKITPLGDDRKTVEIRVTWKESNIDQEVRLESLLSKAS